jgi:hypothetical protein
MKSILVSLIFVFSLATVHSQSIIDYFIPDSPKNTSVFEAHNIGMNKVESTREVKHIEGEEYQIITSNNDMFIRNSIRITDTEILWHKHYSSNNLGLTNRQDYDPPIVLLKLPEGKKEVSWSYTLNNVEYDCSAKLTDIKALDGKKKAIRVEQTKQGKTNIVWFVKGIGLWKNEQVMEDGSTRAWLTFMRME